MSVRAFSLHNLSERYRLTRRWWRAHIPDLEAAGVLVRRGRYWFGDEARLDHYLATGEVLALDTDRGAA